jgi:hypothetical protein
MTPNHNGGIRWHTRWVNVSQTLGGEWVGLTEFDEGEWDVYFGPLRLGRFHERTLTIEDGLGRQYRTQCPRTSRTRNTRPAAAAAPCGSQVYKDSNAAPPRA